MENKFNIKYHILFLCDKCGEMNIVDRFDSDPKE